MKLLLVRFNSKIGSHKFVFKVQSEDEFNRFVNFVAKEYYPNNEYSYTVNKINSVLEGR